MSVGIDPDVCFKVECADFCQLPDHSYENYINYQRRGKIKNLGICRLFTCQKAQREHEGCPLPPECPYVALQVVSGSPRIESCMERRIFDECIGKYDRREYDVTEEERGSKSPVTL